MGNKAPPPGAATPLARAAGVIALGLLLSLLLAVHPAAFGTGVAVALLGTLVWLVPDHGPTGPGPADRRAWTVRGPSPLRQELAFTGTGRCEVVFGFDGNQTVHYQYDLYGADGQLLPRLETRPAERPLSLCWWPDEGAPAGYVYTPPGPWSFTLRYVLRATGAAEVRPLRLTVEVRPRRKAADVQTPRHPAPSGNDVVAVAPVDNLEYGTGHVSDSA